MKVPLPKSPNPLLTSNSGSFPIGTHPPARTPDPSHPHEALLFAPSYHAHPDQQSKHWSITLYAQRYRQKDIEELLKPRTFRRGVRR